MTDKAVITDFVFLQGITSPYYNSDCDQVTDWSGGPTLDITTFIQGGGALSAKVSKATLDSTFALRNILDINDKMIIVWAMCSGRMDTHPGTDAISTGSGFRIRVYDGTNWGEWDIAGRNTWGGGWQPWAVHGATAFSRTSTTAARKNNITRVGIFWDIVGSAAAINVWWDCLRVGTYIGVKGGNSVSPVDFDYLLTQDELVTNRWGAMYRYEDIVFTQSKLKIGSTTANDETYFKETSEIALLPSRPFPSDFYEIIAQGNSGAETNIFLGVKSGDSGISGCFVKPSGYGYALRMSNQYLTRLGLYGSILFGANIVELPLWSTDREVIGSNFETYGVISLSTCDVERCNFVSGTGLITAGGGVFKNCSVIACAAPVAMLWNLAIDTEGKLDGTLFISSGAGHAIQLGPSTPSTITLIDIGFSEYGATGTSNAAIYNNSGKKITINISGGTEPTYLNGADAETEIITEVVTYKFEIQDESGVPLTGIGYEWRLYEADLVNPTKLGEEIPGTGSESENESSRSYVYKYEEWGIGEGDLHVVLQVLHQDYVEYILRDKLTDADKTVTVILRKERNI